MLVMRTFRADFMSNRKLAQIIFILVTGLALVGCATLQPPSATGPRGNEPTYPLLYTADDARRNAATSAVGRLVQPVNAETEPRLQPVTLTVSGLRPNPSQLLYLPKLGAAAMMTEEETRESLRRFIREWQDLIGADPAKLSLIERLDQPDGTKVATYEQRPFRYPIRGNFGRLEIRFTTDRRVIDMSSTCVPDAERMQSALAGITVKLKPEDAATQLVNTSVSYTDGSGATQSFTVPDASRVHPKELVAHIRASKTNADALEFHVAWEVEITGAPVKRVYVDAVNGEIIAAE